MIISEWYQRAIKQGYIDYENGVAIQDNPFYKKRRTITPNDMSAKTLGEILMEDYEDIVLDPADCIHRKNGEHYFWELGWMHGYYVKNELDK